MSKSDWTTTKPNFLKADSFNKALDAIVLLKDPHKIPKAMHYYSLLGGSRGYAPCFASPPTSSCGIESMAMPAACSIKMVHNMSLIPFSSIFN
jgi:geranylgeranyl diphosphate synthase type II